MDKLGIERPVLLLDEKIARNNLQRMLNKFSSIDVLFRPHFKTHQSRSIATWFADTGVEAITVSSIDMAFYFANAGWADISVAFPVNIRQGGLIRELSKRVRLHLLIESSEMVTGLSGMLEHSVRVWIKVDVGTGRTGVPWHDRERIRRLTEKIMEVGILQFEGLLAHPGHSYDVSGTAQVEKVHCESRLRMQKAREGILDIAGNVKISLGDTPCASLADDFQGIDEMRPGNFIFYDLMQVGIGACKMEDIAICMACPVVAVHAKRKEVVIYGGAVHFGKEFLLLNNQKHYGKVVRGGQGGWDASAGEGELVRLSQEHGILKMTEGNLKKYKPGDLAYILPVHSCLTADCMGSYLTLEGYRLDHFRSGK